MTYEDLIGYYGSGFKAANAIGISRQAFYRWSQIGYVPLDKQEIYEKLTKGFLKVGIDSKKHIGSLRCQDYMPIFRFYCPKVGMCEVKSIRFKDDKAPQIVCHFPDNKFKTFSSFNYLNLMQAFNVYGDSGKHLFEFDIIRIGKEEITIKSVLDIYENDLLNISFKIISNIFERNKNGHKGS